MRRRDAKSEHEQRTRSRGVQRRPSSQRASEPGKAAIKRRAARKPLPRPPHWKQLTPIQRSERSQAFKFLRFRRQGMSSGDAQEQSGISAQTAKYYFPKAFYRNASGHLQVTNSDRYVEEFRLPTTRPGKLEPVRAHGSHQRLLCGRWLNALKAAGKGDFGPINAFPKNVFIDGYRLSTSPYVVQRIVQAIAESDKPFEELYAMAGGA